MVRCPRLPITPTFAPCRANARCSYPSWRSLQQHTRTALPTARRPDRSLPLALHLPRLLTPPLLCHPADRSAGTYPRIVLLRLYAVCVEPRRTASVSLRPSAVRIQVRATLLERRARNVGARPSSPHRSHLPPAPPSLPDTPPAPTMHSTSPDPMRCAVGDSCFLWRVAPSLPRRWLCTGSPIE